MYAEVDDISKLKLNPDKSEVKSFGTQNSVSHVNIAHLTIAGA